MDTSTPTVSILVAAYNAGPYVAETIASVQAQTFADWELVIVDDGSTDATAAIVEQYLGSDGRIRLIRQANAGAVQARNRAFAASSGRFVVILDADDRLLPDKLAHQVAYLDSNPSIGVVYGDTWFIDTGGKRIELESRRHPELHKSGDVFKWIMAGNLLAVHAGMVRRACIERVGLHAEGEDLIADWDFWARVAEHYPFAYVDEAVAEYRLHPGMSARTDSAARQFRQRTNTLERIAALPRYRCMGGWWKAAAYFAHARKALQFSQKRAAKYYYMKSLIKCPLYFKSMVGLFFVVFGFGL